MAHEKVCMAVHMGFQLHDAEALSWPGFYLLGYLGTKAANLSYTS